MPPPRGLTPYHWRQENLEPGKSGLGVKVGLWKRKRVSGGKLFSKSTVRMFGSVKAPPNNGGRPRSITPALCDHLRGPDRDAPTPDRGERRQAFSILEGRSIDRSDRDSSLSPSYNIYMRVFCERVAIDTCRLCLTSLSYILPPYYTRRFPDP
jgi:hypothetical protein